MAQTADEGGGLPMTPGGLADQPFSDRAASVGAGHLGVGAGFVQEDQFRRIKLALARLPRRARFGDVRTVLFGGVQRFFLKLIRWRW